MKSDKDWVVVTLNSEFENPTNAELKKRRKCRYGNKPFHSWAPSSRWMMIECEGFTIVHEKCLQCIVCTGETKTANW